MNLLSWNDWAALGSIVGGFSGFVSLCISVVQLRLLLIDRQGGASSGFSWLRPILFLLLALGLFWLAVPAPFSQSKGLGLATSDAVVSKPVREFLPERVRMEVQGVEISPPIKNGWVRVRAFVGEDTLNFPSAGASYGLPLSAWDNQSAVFFTSPQLTIQFELEVTDRQSGHQAILLSSERVPYRGGEVSAFYTVNGPSPDHSGISRAYITYRLLPAS
jgi:hypothetical protein